MVEKEKEFMFNEINNNEDDNNNNELTTNTIDVEGENNNTMNVE